MNRFEIATGKKPTPIKMPKVSADAVERATKMMTIPMGQLPDLAIEYAKFLCNKSGMCGEVIITAYAHYAQDIEGLPCDDPAYAIDPDGKEWFKLALLREMPKSERFWPGL